MAAMQAETVGKEEGIGLVDFAVTVEPSTGYARIVAPLVTSPAFKAGLQPGDVIVSVNGQTTRGLIHEDVMAMLRGNSGKIDLTIRRDNKKIQMQVSKGAWIEQAVESHSFFAGKQQLGYIGVRLFTSDSGEQVRQAVGALTISGVGTSACKSSSTGEPPNVTPKTFSQPLAESCRNSNIIVRIMNLWNCRYSATTGE
jgi:carboxyl-terminal processing protease